MPTFSMKMTQPEYDAIRRRAELRGVPMAQVVKDRLFGRDTEPNHEPVPRGTQVEPRPKLGAV